MLAELMNLIKSPTTKSVANDVDVPVTTLLVALSAIEPLTFAAASLFAIGTIIKSLFVVDESVLSL